MEREYVIAGTHITSLCSDDPKTTAEDAVVVMVLVSRDLAELHKHRDRLKLGEDPKMFDTPATPEEFAGLVHNLVKIGFCKWLDSLGPDSPCLFTPPFYAWFQDETDNPPPSLLCLHISATPPEQGLHRHTSGDVAGSKSRPPVKPRRPLLSSIRKAFGLLPAFLGSILHSDILLYRR